MAYGLWEKRTGPVEDGIFYNLSVCGGTGHWPVEDDCDGILINLQVCDDTDINFSSLNTYHLNSKNFLANCG